MIVGTLMPMEIEGLEFALCALFVTLTFVLLASFL